MISDVQKQQISQALLKRYPGNSDTRSKVRAFAENIYFEYAQLGLAEPSFISRICNVDDAIYAQQSSEVLFAKEMWNVGVQLIPSKDAPDLLFKH